MDYIRSYEQIVKEVVDRGNSGGIYLPKGWVGRHVIVRPLSVNEYVLNAISPYMKDIAGVYLYGSYARNEQQSESDIDVLILSGRELKLKKENGIDYRVMRIDDIADAIKQEPISIYPMIREAVPIMNAPLLEGLKKIKVKPEKLGWITKTTEIALKRNKALLELEEDLETVIYSLVMRLRALYLAHLILRGGEYSNADFKEFVLGRGLNKGSYRDMYAVYRAVRDERTIPEKRISVDEIMELWGIVSKYNDGIRKEIKDAKAEEEKEKKGKKGR